MRPPGLSQVSNYLVWFRLLTVAPALARGSVSSPRGLEEWQGHTAPGAP